MCAAVIVASLGVPARGDSASRATDREGRSAITAFALQFVPGGRDLPPLRLRRGTTLGFVNADPLGWHQIVSTDYDEASEPLFSSALIGFGLSGPVRGVESLVPGRYAFSCSTHEGMSGALEVSG